MNNYARDDSNFNKYGNMKDSDDRINYFMI